MGGHSMGSKYSVATSSASEQIEIKKLCNKIITKETAARKNSTREQLDSLVAKNEKHTAKPIQETTKKNEIQFQYETTRRKIIRSQRHSEPHSE
jgi:hypothetical protein